MSAEQWFAGRRPSQRAAVGPLDFLSELNDQPWATEALCAQTDPEAYFPEKGGSSRQAKAVCASCGGRAECLAYALEHQERFGIWGGLSERERRRLTKVKTSATRRARVCALDDCTTRVPEERPALTKYCTPAHASAAVRRRFLARTRGDEADE